MLFIFYKLEQLYKVSVWKTRHHGNPAAWASKPWQHHHLSFLLQSHGSSTTSLGLSSSSRGSRRRRRTTESLWTPSSRVESVLTRSRWKDPLIPQTSTWASLAGCYTCGRVLHLPGNWALPDDGLLYLLQEINYKIIWCVATERRCDASQMWANRDPDEDINILCEELVLASGVVAAWHCAALSNWENHWVSGPCCISIVHGRNLSSKNRTEPIWWVRERDIKSPLVTMDFH